MPEIRKHLLNARWRLDENNDPKNLTGYTGVCDLYLDSPRLTLYNQQVQAQKNRFNLRIRMYDDASGGPAYLEIKRYESEVLRKKRSAVTVVDAQRVIAGAV